jgi:hypothetical protein
VGEPDRIVVSRTVEAGPEQLFALLATPSRHTEFDSSNMLRGAEGNAGPISAVGDEFIVNMNNQVLGDYQIKNTVVAYEKDRTIGWAPSLYPPDGYTDKIGDVKPGGHTFTWHLEPEGSGTRLTQVYDWSEVSDPQFRRLLPLISEEQLADSLERAGRAAK